jgi:hypothetical protein
MAVLASMPGCGQGHKKRACNEAAGSTQGRRGGPKERIHARCGKVFKECKCCRCDDEDCKADPAHPPDQCAMSANPRGGRSFKSCCKCAANLTARKYAQAVYENEVARKAAEKQAAAAEHAAAEAMHAEAMRAAAAMAAVNAAAQNEKLQAAEAKSAEEILELQEKLAELYTHAANNEESNHTTDSDEPRQAQHNAKEAIRDELLGINSLFYYRKAITLEQ